MTTGSSGKHATYELPAALVESPRFGQTPADLVEGGNGGWPNVPKSPTTGDRDRFELAGGWHLQRVQVSDHFEWIICDPAGDRLGGTLKHMAELDNALLKELY